MRPKSLILLALALGCGLVASIGISQVLESRKNAPARLETVPIYVALHNINLGDPINADMLSLEEWPKDKVPRGAVSNFEELDGRRPRTAIIEGEPILEGKLLAPGQIADPIRSIPKGMRLKTIAVDAEKSAAGLLGPGDRVDVQLFVRKDQRTGIEEAQSKVILQNIRVFAVDQTVQRSPDGGEDRTIAKTVSLMLTPEQASKLSLAEQIGEISLTPRNPDDDATADWTEYTIEDLLADGTSGSREKEQGRTQKKPADNVAGALAVAQPALPVALPPFVMEVIKGEKFDTQEFDPNTGKPIIESDQPASAGPTITPSSPATPTAPPQGTAPTKDLDDMLEGVPHGTPEDFPIDLGARN